ncbi:aminotransferase class III-fold pyridoxal phosphate-dependent enzyme [Acidianus sulfidivorans JP7]|uniref:Aspartate aminotransferase family protein n=1 Tax=Acidianus sulfidivorans JP7 TaxID=619593 RepID=A0A2U9ILR0_9CREN|nr:aminotransferase class III-fold pyridoxal phosphate-dependent enzyme [Acidianus sulfidivorans]AWR96952.1 aminotransferase class III-fold pyridoxal phosphate-dependent enzyme [Acidianus sulfidivorans JP7]
MESVEDPYYEETINSSLSRFLKKGKGSKVWDAEENIYIDFDMCYGNMEIGYGNPLLVDELLHIDNFEKSEAERIVKERYNLEKVKFLLSESDALDYAISLVNSFSKKNTIVKFSGNSNIFQLNKQNNTRIIVLEWNKTEDLEIIKRMQVSGIILEPIAMGMGIVYPEKEFISRLFEISKENNIPIIFDETRTGGKTYSGSSSLLPFEPDIKILGRQIAGGFPIGVVGGKKEIMKSNSFYKLAVPISVKALEITLKKILNRSTMYRMINLNEKLTKAYLDLIEDNKENAFVSSFGISSAIYFSNKLPRNYREFLGVNVKKWRYYYDLMLEKRIIPMIDYDEQWTISAAHREIDIQRHIDSAIDVFKKIKGK